MLVDIIPRESKSAMMNWLFVFLLQNLFGKLGNMNGLREIFEGIWHQIRSKDPSTQLTIGIASGFGAAIASVRIAKTLAFMAGGTLLALSIANDYQWNPEFTKEFSLTFLNELIKSNGPLTIGFVVGYLIGFSFV